MDIRKQTWLFLALALAGSAGFETLIVRTGGMHGDAGFLIIALMWTPAAAAMITKLIATRSLAGLGWRLGPSSALLTGWTTPIVYGGVPFLVAGLVGTGTFTLAKWIAPTTLLGLTMPLVLPQIVFGSIISLATATGEEIGWRGFLVPALAAQTGFWRVCVITGVIWLLFHTPLIIGAKYSGIGTPLWFNLLCFTALIGAMTPMLVALRLRSGSFWPTALMHASHNLFIQSIFAEALIPNGTTAWLVGEFGVVTPVIAVGVAAFYLWQTGIPRTQAENA
jgi:membrane protease YdiL (CAAX protease family)